MNSDECRSAKKPRFCVSSVSNMRRWFSAMMRLPIRDMHHACGRRSPAALTMKMNAVSSASATMPGRLRST